MPALTLIVLRRGGAREPITVSDRNWQSWTRLSPRAKEYAIAGLRKKCLTTVGRGDRSKLRFDPAQWESYAPTVARENKPRTSGRSVDPKPGAKIHPDCRERGCALLQPLPVNPESHLSLVPAPSNAQPVAQTNYLLPPPEYVSILTGPVSILSEPQKGLSPKTSTRNAQPVAHSAQTAGRSADAAEQAWCLALAALRAIFPWIGVPFLVRLVAFCRTLVRDVADVELAQAIGLAWERKKLTQRGEGLFLYTVPEVLLELRRRPPPSAAVQSRDLAAGVKLLLREALQAVQARGAPFAALADELDTLNRSVEHRGLVDVEATDQEMERLEAALVATGRSVLTPADRAAIAAAIDSALAPYLRTPGDHSRRGALASDHVAKLRAQFEAREILAVLGIPRLSVFYA